MKTRKVMVCGTLELANTEYKYKFIRYENLDSSFPYGSTGFMVTTSYHDADMNVRWDAPYLVVATPPWNVKYHTPRELDVFDDTPDLFETEVDATDAPTQADITEAEWERMLNDVDKRLDTQENVT